MKKTHRLIALLLSLTLLFSALPAAGAYDQPSDWAADAVTWLKSTGKLTDADFTDYGKTVTRADFARLAVILYYIVTECPPPYVSAKDSPFQDTSDEKVIQAYKLGMVGGLEGGTLFGPDLPVTREQIAVMLMRVLDACAAKFPEFSYSKDDVSHIVFNDEASLGDWAAESVKRAYYIQIINGTGYNTFSPQNQVTREQTYQMLYNVHNNWNKINYKRTRPFSAGPLGALVLRYTDGGKDAVTSQPAYHARPAVVDLDGDGRLEIVSAATSVMCLDASTGKEKWKVNPTNDPSTRVWADVIAADIDGDGAKEVVTGHSDGSLFVLTNQGQVKWSAKLPADIYSVEAGDLDNDGTLELAVGIGAEDGVNVWVYEHNGSVRPGWPQLSPANDGNKNPTLPSNPRATEISFSWGVFNDNIAIGDIDGDGIQEIVVPADMAQICAYKPDGTQVRADFTLAEGEPYGVTGKTVWGRVGAFSDAAYESKVYNGGFGQANDRMGNVLDISSLPMNERLIATFTHSRATIADLNGDGKNEVAVVGSVHDRAVGALPSHYQELFLFNGDRTRFNAAWSAAPAAKEKPLSENWDTIERCMPDPVCADLDGDGKMEILYPDFSGKLNCYWLDHTQHGSWPVNVYDGVNLEYAAAPAVYDFDGDGKMEVVFTTHCQKGGVKSGRLYIADWQGNILHSVELPKPTNFYGQDYNGCSVPPVVADTDGDGKPEIVLHTYYSGVTVYDLV